MNKKMEVIYYQFGSQDSQDVDLLCLVSQLGKIQKNKERVESLERELQHLYSSELNVNLGILRKGRIEEVFKGTPDEVNNSVFQTYSLHDQKHPLKIQGMVPRDVDLKVVRTLRIILSFLSRTDMRPEVKAALKGNSQDKIALLNKLDLSQYKTIEDLGKVSVSLEDYYKNLAFQLGQTLSLVSGVEVYSKKSVGQRYPDLQPLLDRDPVQENFSVVLEKYKKEFLSKIENKKLKYQLEPRRS